MRALTIILIAALAASPASAAGKKRHASAGNPAIENQSLPLSSTECHRLGGTVNGGRSECKLTNQSCSVVKPNGEVYSICITDF